MANEYTSIDIVLNLIGDEDVKEKLKKIEQISRKVESVLNKLAGLDAKAKIDAEDKASEKIRAINHKIARIVGKTYVLTISVKDKISSVIHGITSKVRGLSKILTSPLGFLGLGAFAGGFGAMVKESLNIAGEMEQANVAFTTMLRSGEKAKKFLEELQRFSIQTPFELPQLMDASRKLLAYGFAAEKVIPILKDVGDATAGLGLGSEGIARITLALGQMRAKGKITGEEMRQLAEAGIPAWNYIAKMMNVTTQQAMKLAEKGLIPAEKGIEAILRGMRTNFAGLMEKQSRTLFGLLSILREFARLKIFGAFGEGLRQGLLPLLTKVTDYLTKNKKGAGELENTLLRLGKKVGDFVVKALEKVYALIKDIMNPSIKADLGERILKVFENIISQINSWLGGEGGKKLTGTFYNIGIIAGKAWIRALIDTFTSGIQELFRGNILGSIFSFGLFSFLGGGKILGTGFRLGEKVYELGGLVLKKVNPVSVSHASTSSEAIKEVSQVKNVLGKSPTPILSKGAIALKAGIDIYRFTTSKNKLKSGAEIIGEWGGMFAGAKIGAAIGTMIAPGIGTAIGGTIGGILGTILGGKLGTGIVELFRKIKWEDLGIKLKEGFRKVAGYIPYSLGYLHGIIFRGLWELIKFVGNLFYKVGEFGLSLLKKGWEGIVSFLKNPFGTIKDIVTNLWNIGKIIAKSLWEGIIAGAKAIGGVFSWIIEKGGSLISGGFEKYTEGFTKGFGIPKAEQKLGINNVTSKIKPFAEGGIVKSPVLGLVGERGPEIIMPLYDRKRSMELLSFAIDRLGVKPFAEGGIVGNFNYKYASTKSSITKSLAININHIDVKISGDVNGLDYDELAIQIGKKISTQIKRAIENRV